MKVANLMIPVAGKGSRFFKEGYDVDKPMIEAKGKRLIEHAMKSVVLKDFNLFFCIKQELEDRYNMTNFLKEKFGHDCECIVIEEPTGGPLETCTYAFDVLDKNLPTAIFTLDVQFYPKLSRNVIDAMKGEALTLTFKANSDKYSYVKIDENGKVTEVAEKKVISSNANVGVYIFNSTGGFIDYAYQEIKDADTKGEESHIAPILNVISKRGEVVDILECKQVYIFGTPVEKDFFESHILSRKKDSFILGLVSDHSGFERKEVVKKIFEKNNISFVDLGCFDDNACNYSSFVNSACNSLENGEVDYLFTFCQSGQGVNIAANKYSDKVISALIYNDFAFEYAVLHSCANVFAFPSVLDEQDFLKYYDIIKKSHFEGGRHSNRLIEVLYKRN